MVSGVDTTEIIEEIPLKINDGRIRVNKNACVQLEKYIIYKILFKPSETDKDGEEASE